METETTAWSEYPKRRESEVFFLATYCRQYPHAVLFMKNEIPYFLLKPSIPHAVYGECSIANA